MRTFLICPLRKYSIHPIALNLTFRIFILTTGNVINKKLAIAEKQNKILDIEYRLITKNDKIRHFKKLSKEEWDEHGKLIRNDTLQDITERKQAEENLRTSEEKFSKAFHSCPDPISISSIEDRTFIEINDSFEKVSDYSRKEVIRHAVFELGFWTKLEQREQLIRELKEKGSVREMNVDYCIASGDIRNCQLSVEIIQIYNKQQMLIVTYDVTEQK